MEKLINISSALLDLIFALIPRKKPRLEDLKNIKIIAHRGCHGKFNRNQIRENTLEAFERAEVSGVWGLEFDVRWTRDLVPVILHDQNLKRVFKKDLLLSELTLSQLKKEAPQVPTLNEVIKTWGQKMHLMIEIKADEFENISAEQIQQKKETLFGNLSKLTPVKDFHILSLKPESTFPLLSPTYPNTTFLPTSILNASSLSQETLPKNYAGFLGSYFLIRKKTLRQHLGKDQIVGTGFIRSKNALKREVNRGVVWVFSNHACRLQKHLNHLKSK